MRTFAEDVRRAVEYHGHLCSGQCIGVKMAHLGMRELGLDNERDAKKIMVYVECDRCPADSIGITTGCRIGKRTFKALDLGKIAATFINLETGRAVRVARTKHCHPADGEDLTEYYEKLPYEDMLSLREVEVVLRPCDMPGPPIEAVICARCGEEVTDSRHIVNNGEPVCRTCAEGSYYREI